MALWLITRFTLQEALRRRLFLAIIVLSTLLLTVYGFLLHAFVDANVRNLSQQGVSLPLTLLVGGIFLSVPITWLVYLISGILTVFLSVGMISGEVEAGTFSIIVPKPLRRYQIVLGKWLGHALILCGYTALLFAGFLGILYWQTAYWPDGALAVLAMLELAVLSLLSLATFGSTLFPTVVNGAVLLILFISAPIAGFISSFMYITSNPSSVVVTPSTTLQNTTTLINLIIPTDALWHGASFYLLPNAALNLLPSANMSASAFDLPILNASQVSPALLIWVGLYIVVFPLLAMWRFQRRDL